MLRRKKLRDTIVSLACRTLSVPFRATRLRQRRRPEPGRIVVIKTASLGDVLMATASVHALRSADHHAHLAFAVGSWSRPMVEGNANLDQVIDLGPLNGGHHRLIEYLRAIRRLRQGRFNFAIVLDRAPLVALLPFLAGIPYRAGLDSAGRGFSLTVPVPCSPGRHEVDLYLDVVRAAGYPVLASRLQFFPSPQDVEAANSIIRGGLTELGKPQDTPLVAIHPAGGVNPGMSLLAKRWSPARFAVIADRVTRELGAAVVLLGGPNDREVISELRAKLHCPAIDLSGSLTFGQLGALLQRCRLLVANDTGAAHLAAAVGTPPVVLFGPTDPRQYGPLHGMGTAVTLALPCSPCFKNGHFPPCHNAYQCLAGLDIPPVWKAIRDLWYKGAQAMEQASAIT